MTILHHFTWCLLLGGDSIQPPKQKPKLTDVKVKAKPTQASDKIIKNKSPIQKETKSTYTILNTANQAVTNTTQQEQNESTPEEYAVNRIEQVSSRTVSKLEHKGRQETKKLARAAIDTAKQRKAKKAIHTGKKQPLKTKTNPIKSTSKSIKNTKKNIKTAKASAKASAKATKKTISTSKKAAEIAKQTAKATIKTTKTLIKITAEAIKLAIEAVKGLITAIAAGGWIAVVIIIIVALIGLLVSSPFGLFFSYEDTEYQPMSKIVMEINNEFVEQIEDIKNTHEYNELDMTGNRAIWKDVLAVFAVLTTTYEINPMDVATMNDEKKQILRDIFYDMNQVSYEEEIIEVITYEPITDEEGNPVLDEYSYPVMEEIVSDYIILHINIDGKSAVDMITEYSMSEQQIEFLNEMLLPEYHELWISLLYSSYTSDNLIVSVALSQLGSDGQPYWSWYGFTYEVEWCACFVSWCANECDYIYQDIIPKFSGCQWGGKPWFQSRGQWQDNSYIPTTGTIIFFDWDADDIADHVGIVEKVEDGLIYTVEGNSAGLVRQQSYPLGSNLIDGYGTPQYN